MSAPQTYELGWISYLSNILPPHWPKSGGQKNFCSLRSQNLSPTFKTVAPPLRLKCYNESNTVLQHLKQREKRHYLPFCRCFKCWIWLWCLVMYIAKTITVGCSLDCVDVFVTIQSVSRVCWRNMNELIIIAIIVTNATNTNITFVRIIVWCEFWRRIIWPTCRRFC